MTKRPSKLELYTCCTLIWFFIVLAAALAIVWILGGPAVDGFFVIFVWMALYWRKDIEVREARWASEQALLLAASRQET